MPACGDVSPKLGWVRTSLLELEKGLLALFDRVMGPKIEAGKQQWKREQAAALAAPKPSPVVELMGSVVRINGKELRLPSPGTRWVDALGPAAMPLRELPKNLLPYPEPGCVFVWQHLGLAALGHPSSPLKDQSPENCSVYDFEVYLDQDEGLLMQPLDEFERAQRPRQSFPGTLIVEGLRIKNRMQWFDVYRGVADDEYPEGKITGYRCNLAVESSQGPKTDVSCWNGPMRYYGRLIGNASKDSGTLWGFAVVHTP